MRTSLLPFLAIALAQLACGGQVETVPTGGTTTNPPASSTEPTTPGSSEVNNGAGVTGNGPGSAKPRDPAESCDLACDEGHALVQGTIACAKGDACYTRTVCGKTFTCTGPAGLCEEPACLGYTQEVKACPAGSICETQYLCDRTLICERTDAQCDGLAACDEGDEEVASATECAKAGSQCYSRASCGSRTYCVRGL
jgi:hypothetical protein